MQWLSYFIADKLERRRSKEVANLKRKWLEVDSEVENENENLTSVRKIDKKAGRNFKPMKHCKNDDTIRSDEKRGAKKQSSCETAETHNIGIIPID